MYRRLAAFFCARASPGREARAVARREGGGESGNVVQGFADLFREDKRRHLRMHERFDWKLWNLFLALLPPAGLYVTMVYARRDMDDLLLQDNKSFRTTRASKGGDPKDEPGVADKLEAIDTRMRALTERLEQSAEANRALEDQVNRIRTAQEDLRKRASAEKSRWPRLPAINWRNRRPERREEVREEEEECKRAPKG